MSIISDALKKANSERHHAAASSRKATGFSGIRPWASSLIILALLILPFALPRLLNRAGSATAGTLPMANVPAAPQSGPLAGLAQTSIESGNLPGAGALFPVSARALPQTTDASAIPGRPKNAVTSINGRHLQGIVWTANKGYYAILDSEVIRVGNLVDNMRVTQITPAGVELTDGTDTVFIEKAF